MFVRADAVLPIFRDDRPGGTLFYTPGFTANVAGVAVAEVEACIAWRDVMHPLVRQAYGVLERVTEHRGRAFAPECLTIYLNNECNLRCRYCFTMPAHQPGERVSLDAVRSAGELVAQHCVRKARPLTVIFHGGGEPTLNFEHLKQVHAAAQAIAAAHQLEPFFYIATNGVMTAERANWVAGAFHRVGISCDGPPLIQDRQRPQANGKTSAAAVRRTVDILHNRQRPFHIRATITAETVAEQVNIAHYLCGEFQPQAIHFEPVYAGGRTSQSLTPALAEVFVTHFLEAQKVAQAYGIPLTCSGTRLDELHGAYCHIFRQVLNVMPGDVATACFKFSQEAAAAKQGVLMGRHTDQGFVLNQATLTRLDALLAPLPRSCNDCFNQFHCSRGCPDVCPLEAESPGGTFRCEVARLLVYHTLVGEN